MATQRITFKIEGEVSLAKFVESLARWQDLVLAVARDVAGDRDHSVVVSDLAPGSTTVEAEITVETDQMATQIADRYASIGLALQSTRSNGLPATLVEPARLLATAVAVAPAQPMVLGTSDDEAGEPRVFLIDPTHPIIDAEWREVAPAKHRYTGTITSYGGLRGRIQTVSSRETLRFTLYDEVFDRAVRCMITEDQEDIVRPLWDRDAYVEGRITRDNATGIPLSMRQLTLIEGIASRPSQAEFLATQGALARAVPNNRIIEDLIREFRDA